MPTPVAERGVGDVVRDVAEHASSLARLELELAQLELRQKGAALGAGAGLFVAAAVMGLLGVGLAFATVAAALATFLPTWLALLIVTGFLLLLTLTLALVGRNRLRSGAPPVPEQAIREAKLTTEAIRGDGGN